MSTNPNRRARLGLESLEAREVPAVTGASISGGVLYVNCNQADDYVSIIDVGGRVYVRDLVVNKTWAFDRNKVSSVSVNAGDGNDRVMNFYAGLPMAAYGGNGYDSLEGDSGSDTLHGGAQSDTLWGYGGDDRLYGEDGNDRIRGMEGNDLLYGGANDDVITGDVGNDWLYGEAGHDNLSGGDGSDSIYGGSGDDAIIAIDGGTTDKAYGEDGSDGIWVDSGWATHDSYSSDASDRIHIVGGFANNSVGADKSLNGDRIGDPTDGVGYRLLGANALFPIDGPTFNDVSQGSRDDCWLMASISAVVQQSPTRIRQMMADCGDGTYVVRLDGEFYRLDADLPSTGGAALGRDGSLWVAMIEKAYAYHRSGGWNHTYASLDWGFAADAFRAMNSTGIASIEYTPGTNLLPVYDNLRTGGQAKVPMTIAFFNAADPTGLGLTMRHEYTVQSVNFAADGTIASITLRNPIGGNNPFVTVSISQMAMLNLRLTKTSPY